jgi:hypothetical protein
LRFRHAVSDIDPPRSHERRDDDGPDPDGPCSDPEENHGPGEGSQEDGVDSSVAIREHQFYNSTNCGGVFD